MQYSLGALQNAASEDIDLNADQVDDTILGQISPKALLCAVCGQYNAVTAVCWRVTFPYYWKYGSIYISLY